MSLKIWDKKRVGVLVMAIGVIVGMPQARAELVYDDGTQEVKTAEPARNEDRESLRQALSSSQKAKSTVQANTQVTAPATPVVQEQVIVPAPTVVQAAPSGNGPEVQNISKSELMRRERVREEIKTEDLLQERLEELRLRDERRRTEQVLTTNNSASAAGTPVSTTGPMKEEVITAPVTERPGQASLALAGSTAPASSSATASAMSGDSYSGASNLSASVSSAADPEEKTMVTIFPRFGVANMRGETGFDIQSRFSTGLGASVGVSDNLAFEVNYNFAEYGIGVTTGSSPGAYYAQLQSNTPEAYVLKQNTIDAGLRLYLLGNDSKLRPYVGAGGGWSKSFMNFDQRILNLLRQYPGGQFQLTDYDSSAFLGYLTAGLDVKLGKNMFVGAMFKYYKTVSVRDSQSINPTFANYQYYAPGGYGSLDQEKYGLGGSLARNNFYTISAELGFTF